MTFYLLLSLFFIVASSLLTVFLGFMASLTFVATNVTPYTKLMAFGIWAGLLGSITLLVLSVSVCLPYFWNDLATMQTRFQHVLYFVLYPSVGVVLCIVLWGFLIGEGMRVLKTIFFLNR